MDNDYCTKIMSGGVLAEQKFWQECYTSDHRELVSKPNFDWVSTMVQIGQFNCNLPAQFKRVEKKRDINQVSNSSEEKLNNEIKRLKAELKKEKE